MGIEGLIANIAREVVKIIARKWSEKKETVN